MTSRDKSIFKDYRSNIELSVNKTVKKTLWPDFSLVYFMVFLLILIILIVHIKKADWLYL